MKLIVSMSLDNAAFQEGDTQSMAYEIRRILYELSTVRSISEALAWPKFDKFQNLRDFNGNVVGTWKIGEAE